MDINKVRHTEFVKDLLADGYAYVDCFLKTETGVYRHHIANLECPLTHRIDTYEYDQGIKIVGATSSLDNPNDLFKKEPGVQVTVASPEVLTNDIVIHSSLTFKRQSMEELMNKEEQKVEETGGVFTDFINHIIDPDHVWNREKYIGSRTMNGSENGMESSVRFQYCRGNAFAEGYIGNLKFRIYYSHLQGFQVYTCPLTWSGDIQNDDARPVIFHPNGTGTLKKDCTVIQFFTEHHMNRKQEGQ